VDSRHLEMFGFRNSTADRRPEAQSVGYDPHDSNGEPFQGCGRRASAVTLVKVDSCEPAARRCCARVPLTVPGVDREGVRDSVDTVSLSALRVLVRVDARAAEKRVPLADLMRNVRAIWKPYADVAFAEHRRARRSRSHTRI
jgi:hypothetical protein